MEWEHNQQNVYSRAAKKKERRTYKKSQCKFLLIDTTNEMGKNGTCGAGSRQIIYASDVVMVKMSRWLHERAR